MEKPQPYSHRGGVESMDMLAPRLKLRWGVVCNVIVGLRQKSLSFPTLYRSTYGRLIRNECKQIT